MTLIAHYVASEPKSPSSNKVLFFNNVPHFPKNGKIQLIVNTPSGELSQYDDSYIRKAAIQYKVPYTTTLAAASVAARGIAAYRRVKVVVRALQDYHADIK